MAKFYSRAGDDGYTGLLGEGRVPKHHPIPTAVGALDESTAALGIARAACETPENAVLLLAVQRDLYRLMAEIAATPENSPRFREIDADRVTWLEAQIDTVGEHLEMPADFIVPGDSPAGAALALARTIVRRAEREVARLLHEGIITNQELLRYINRLSSLCFVLELHENRAWGCDDPTLARG